MTRRPPTVAQLACLALAASVAVVAALAQPADVADGPRQVRDTHVEVHGTGTIGGIVITAGHPETPQRRARVTLKGSALASDRLDVTDDRGRFTFDGLPAGSYAVRAEKAGFVAMSYGAERPGRPGTSVTIADGQQLGTLSVGLLPGAVITGRVTNGDGQPLANTDVHALRFTMRNGERSLLETASRSTDDQGVYRLFGLPPGEFIVATQATSDSRGTAAFARIADGEVDLALRAINQATAPAPSAGSTIAALVGFAPVYAPGTPVLAQATPVTLAAGAEVTVDVRLTLAPMANLSGAVSLSSGEPATGVLVELEPLDLAMPDRAYAGGATRLGPRHTGKDGRFQFPGLSPGDYRVLATETSAGRQDVATAPTRWAATTITASGTSLDVALQLRPPLSFAGRIVFEGIPPLPPPSSVRLLLQQTRITPGLDLKTFQARATAEGAFEIDGLTPERYTLQATAPGGWALASVTSGGRDLLDAPLTLAGSDARTDVVVTFTDHPSQLSGTLRTASGVPATDFFVIAFADDPASWFANSRRIVSVRPDATGHYAIDNLAPGRYRVAAVTDVEPDEWFDPAFLRQLTAGSVPIALAKGERRVQDFSLR